MKRKIASVLITLVAAVAPLTAFAHGGHEHKNLQVIKEIDHRDLDRGMKLLSRGLGVKCSACHVKGKYERDDLPAKKDARAFLDAVIGEPDQVARREALSLLLRSLKIERAKDETKVWSAIERFEKNPK